jgi:hypothetical protein
LHKLRELRGTYVRWADLAQNHEGGDNEDSSPESLFQRRDEITELNSSLWLARQGILNPKLRVQLDCP